MKFKSIIAGITASLLLNNTSLAQTPKPVSIRDDNRFANQDFSQQLFKQIPQGDKACKAFGLIESCSYKRKHIFKNAVLIIEKYTTSGIVVTMIPNKAISKEQALSYAKTIHLSMDNGTPDSEKIRFTTPRNQSKKIIEYAGCPVGIPPEFFCSAQLHLTPNGKVSRIVITSESP